jgi:hypothetical protein
LRLPIRRQPSISAGYRERRTVQQTVGFVGALMDLDDDEQSRALPANVILAGDCEPR